jgi:hypothetical protein
VHGGSLLVALLRLADKVHIDVAELLLNAGLVHLHLAGLEKTRFFFKKNPAQWVFQVFLFFFGFFGFLYICPEERVFRVFSVSRILLGTSGR